MKESNKKIQVDFDRVRLWAKIGFPIGWVANMMELKLSELPENHKFFKVYDQGKADRQTKQ